MNRLADISVAIVLRDTDPHHLDRGYAHEHDLPDAVRQGLLNEAFCIGF